MIQDRWLVLLAVCFLLLVGASSSKADEYIRIDTKECQLVAELTTATGWQVSTQHITLEQAINLIQEARVTTQVLSSNALRIVEDLLQVVIYRYPEDRRKRPQFWYELSFQILHNCTKLNGEYEPTYIKPGQRG